MNEAAGGVLQDKLDLQARIDQLDSFLSATVVYPQFFRDPKAAAGWIEEEIMQLECEQLATIEDEKSFRSGKLEVKRSGNIYTPSIEAWTAIGKEEIL